MFDVCAADPFSHPLKVVREQVARLMLARVFRHSEVFSQEMRMVAEMCLQDMSVVKVTNVSQISAGADHHAFRQVMPWITAALINFNPERHSHIEIAYVLGDDINMHLVDIAQAVYSLGRMLFGLPVQVYFPLAKTRKEKHYRHLNEYQVPLGRDDRTVSLIDLVWVCELPSNKWAEACGECHTCVREQQVRSGLMLPQRRPDDVSREFPVMANRDRVAPGLHLTGEIMNFLYGQYSQTDYPQLWFARPTQTVEEAHEEAFREQACRVVEAAAASEALITSPEIESLEGEVAAPISDNA